MSSNSSGVSLPDLSRMRSGMPMVADVVQRRRPEQHRHVAIVEQSGEAGLLAQLERQCPDVMLGAPDVVAGVGVARLGQRGHRVDGDVLDRDHLGGPLADLALQKSALSRRKSALALRIRWLRTRAITIGGLIGLV